MTPPAPRPDVAGLVEVLGSLTVEQAMALGQAATAVGAPATPDTRTPLEREHAALVDATGKSVLTKKGLIKPADLERLMPEMQKELWRRFPLTADASAKNQVNRYFASGRLDGHTR
jgi:hypothetical protein